MNREFKPIVGKDIDSRKGGKHGELKLWIKDLSTLQKNEEEEFYSFSGFSVNIVDVYGVVVEVKSNNYGVLYKVDDGTGEIDCWQHNRSDKTTDEEFFHYLATTDNSYVNANDQNGTAMESSFFSDSKEITSSSYSLANETQLEQWFREQILLQVENNSDKFSLGDTIHLRGKLNDFRGERCIRIYDIRLVTDINEETDRRFELIHLYETVYFKKK